MSRNMVLQPKYADVMLAMGQAGVPVPFIEGFEFLFDEATVTVQDGYVTVLARCGVQGHLREV